MKGTWHLGDLHPLSKPCKKVVGWDVPTANSRQEVQESCPATAEKKQAKKQGNEGNMGCAHRYRRQNGRGTYWRRGIRHGPLWLKHKGEYGHNTWHFGPPTPGPPQLCFSPCLPTSFAPAERRKPTLPVPWMVTLVHAWTTSPFPDPAQSSEDSQPQICHPSCLCTLSGCRASGCRISPPSFPSLPVPLVPSTAEIPPCVGILQGWEGGSGAGGARQRGGGAEGVRLPAPLRSIFHSV